MMLDLIDVIRLRNLASVPLRTSRGNMFTPRRQREPFRKVLHHGRHGRCPALLVVHIMENTHSGGGGANYLARRLHTAAGLYQPGEP